MDNFKYTAVIRTLGKSGEKYKILLDSLCTQTIQPEKILVYIAEGYDLPKETCGREEYIRCKKGMVAQRALPFDEVETEWILFCDDDISFEKDSVERLYTGLLEYNMSVNCNKPKVQSMCISPNVFPNHNASCIQKIKDAMGLTLPHWNKKWAFIIRQSAHYSYNNNPSKVLKTQSAAGPCFLMKKEAYKKIHFEDELFLDDFKYALGDDFLFFYKLYKMGFCPLVHFESGVVHLDAGSGHIENKSERIKFSTAALFAAWHRARFSPCKNIFTKGWCALCYWGTVLFQILYFMATGILKRNFTTLKSFCAGISYGCKYVKTEKYKNLPPYLAHLEEK